MAVSVVLESQVNHRRCFLCCPVARLVRSACKVVSTFVVLFSAVFVVVVYEVQKYVVSREERAGDGFHVVHVVLEGRFAFFWCCSELEDLCCVSLY